LDSLTRIERKRKILELLNHRNFGIDELALLLDISPVTLRKDLRDLQNQRLINRVWGGVTLASQSLKEHPFEDRDVDHLEEKRSIAKTALTLIKPNEVIGLSAGTAPLELSKLLADVPNIQVVTNSVNTAHILLRLGVKVIMPGGFSREDSYSLFNDRINDFFNGIYLDKCFIEVDGVDISGGLTILRAAEADLITSMIKVANTVVVLADSKKLGMRRFTSVCSLDNTDLLITDNSASRDMIDQLRRKGLKIEIASPETDDGKTSMSEYKLK